MHNRLQVSVLILFIFIGCESEIKNINAKRIFKTEHLSDISNNWFIKRQADNIGVYNFINVNNFDIKIGESVFLEFLTSKHLKNLEFLSGNKHFAYKLYLNEYYAGKFQSDQKIGVNKQIKSIRLIIVSSETQIIVKGWDHRFNYTYVKDTSQNQSGNQIIRLIIDDEIRFLLPIQPKKVRYRSAVKTIEKKGLDFLDRKCLLILNDKKGPNVSEQMVHFKRDGSFFIYRLNANQTTQKVSYDYFYSGIWKLDSQANNKYNLRLIGKLSGRLPLGAKKATSNYQSVCQIDSLGVIQSADLLNNLLIDLPEWAMVNINDFNNQFIINIPYSTNKNITGIKLYPCNKCYLCYRVVKDLLKAQQIFKKRGLRVKLLDCYRPINVQWILYDAFPVSGYVADPVGGSIHNRGTAVDLTLVDKNDKELEMGTPFDDLSFRSNHGYRGFSDTILENRKLLRETMNACNFVTIRLEWWHYNHLDARKYPKLNDPFPCRDK